MVRLISRDYVTLCVLTVVLIRGHLLVEIILKVVIVTFNVNDSI